MSTVPDDVMMNKAAVIERSLRRIVELYAADPALEDLLYLDALTLNVERACQAAIDLAMHEVAAEHLGMPQSQADAFRLLADAGKISRGLSERMIGMCGFRNVLVHQYQELEVELLHQVARERWKDLIELCAELGRKIDVRQS